MSEQNQNVGTPTQKKCRIPVPSTFDGKNVKKFLREVFLYTEGNKKDFPEDADYIQFVLSLCTEKGAEKWAQNYTDEVIERAEIGEYDWGTKIEFLRKIREAFTDPNEKRNAQHALTSLRQTGTAEEYFQEFEILRRTAGYGGDGYDTYLIETVERGLKEEVIVSIYSGGVVPNNLAEYKMRALQSDAMLRRLRSLKKGQTQRLGFVPQNRTPQQQGTAQPQTPSQANRQDGTGTTFGGRGQAMDLDEARRRNVCYRCGQPGHIGRNCRAGRSQTVRAMMQEMSEDERKELISGFQNPQQ
jgi:Zinc knuckle/Retrotransposon gag protein